MMFKNHKTVVLYLFLLFSCNPLIIKRQPNSNALKYDHLFQNSERQAQQKEQQKLSDQSVNQVQISQKVLNVYNLTQIQMGLVEEIAAEIPDIQISTLKSGINKQRKIKTEEGQLRNKTEEYYQFIFEKKYKDVIYQWEVNVLVQENSKQTAADANSQKQEGQQQFQQSKQINGQIYHVNKRVFTNGKIQKQIQYSNIYYADSPAQIFDKVIS